MKARKINMAELARRAQLRPNTLTNWKSGKTKNPRKNDIAAVCQELQIRPEWLYLGVEPMDEIEGAADITVPYRTDLLNAHLLGQCCAAVLDAVERQTPSIPPASKLGAVIAEIYAICQRDGRQPTDDLVSSFMRVLLA